MPDFDWKWLITTGLIAVAAIATVYRYFLRDYVRNRKETRERKDRFSARVAQALQELLSRVSESRSLQVYTVRAPGAPAFEPEFTYNDLLIGQQIENSLIPKKLSQRLKLIHNLISQYKGWREEIVFITNQILTMELPKREALKARWDYFLYGGMRPLESVIEELVYPLLLKGTLDVRQVKEAFLQEFGSDFTRDFPLPGTRVWPTEPPPEVKALENIQKEPQIKLREHVLNTKDFERLMEELGKVAKRPSFSEFIEVRNELCQQVKDTLRLISKIDPQSSQVVQSSLPPSK